MHNIVTMAHNKLAGEKKEQWVHAILYREY